MLPEVLPAHESTEVGAVPSSAMTQLHEVARMLEPKLPRVAGLLTDASEDVLAHAHSPREHRRRLHSTNPIERCARRSSAGLGSSGTSRRSTR